VPHARPTQLHVTLAGFFVSVSAFNWGFAGGPFLFAGGIDNYVRGYDSSDFSARPSSSSSTSGSSASSPAAEDAIEQAEQIVAEAPESIVDLTGISIALSSFTPEELVRATDRHEARFE
jgi:hypothetical protein